jgi:Na+-driven multidrug efflux pump
VNNGVFRGAGDAAVAIRVLWLSNLINLALDPCFIFGIGPFPRLGVTGAAVSTTIGRSIGVAYQLWILFRGSSRVRLMARSLRLDRDVMIRLMRVSVTGMFQFAIGQTSWMALVRIVSSFGSVVLITFASPIVRLFTDDPQVIPFSIDCLRIISYGNVAYAYGMVMVQSFNGAGDTFTPTMVNIFCYWLFQIPLAYALAFTCSLGPRGAFAAIPIAETAIAIVGILLFRRGRWKLKRI